MQGYISGVCADERPRKALNSTSGSPWDFVQVGKGAVINWFIEGIHPTCSQNSLGKKTQST